MTPRDRDLATLDRQSTDRPPVDLWVIPEVLDSLRRHTGETVELAVYQKLGLDKIVWVFPGYGAGRFDPNEGDGQTMWGVPTRMIRAGAATYQEFGAPPLGHYAAVAQLADYPLWPDPTKFDMAAARGNSSWLLHRELHPPAIPAPLGRRGLAQARHRYHPWSDVSTKTVFGWFLRSNLIKV
jgi:hypothetical protein